MEETKTVIKPTVGRVVWFYPASRHENEQPRAAMVSAVWGDRCVNLMVIEPNGVPQSHPQTSVTLRQPDDAKPTAGAYCEWMPFQIGQAQAAK